VRVLHVLVPALASRVLVHVQVEEDTKNEFSKEKDNPVWKIHLPWN
jgi:hypothetical protein